MAVICPTVLASNSHDFQNQLSTATGLSPRIQIDLADGRLAEPPTIAPTKIYWPKGVLADIHLMFEHPLEPVEHLVKLRPHLIIVHAEANHHEVVGALDLIGRTPGVKTGLALTAQTPVAEVGHWLKRADHCLIFAGTLGSFGGIADLSQTSKIQDALDINPNLEIGWDGGINDQNVASLIDSGVAILNSGSFIQKADKPQQAYAILQQIAKSKN